MDKVFQFFLSPYEQRDPVIHRPRQRIKIDSNLCCYYDSRQSILPPISITAINTRYIKDAFDLLGDNFVQLEESDTPQRLTFSHLINSDLFKYVDMACLNRILETPVGYNDVSSAVRFQITEMGHMKLHATCSSMSYLNALDKINQTVLDTDHESSISIAKFKEIEKFIYQLLFQSPNPPKNVNCEGSRPTDRHACIKVLIYPTIIGASKLYPCIEFNSSQFMTQLKATTTKNIIGWASIFKGIWFRKDDTCITLKFYYTTLPTVEPSSQSNNIDISIDTPHQSYDLAQKIKVQLT